jgi:hypothetical protein
MGGLFFGLGIMVVLLPLVRDGGTPTVFGTMSYSYKSICGPLSLLSLVVVTNGFVGRSLLVRFLEVGKNARLRFFAQTLPAFPVSLASSFSTFWRPILFFVYLIPEPPYAVRSSLLNLWRMISRCNSHLFDSAPIMYDEAKAIAEFERRAKANC